MHVSASVRDTICLQFVNGLLRLLIFPCRPTHSVLRLHSAKKTYPLFVLLILNVQCSLYIRDFKQLLETFMHSFLQFDKTLSFVVYVRNSLINYG